ncbi:hypothetical protein GQ457_03G018770 [Hibiscus cannabinus]
MGKVGDKPRTSERKCRRKRRKQRTSRKKGQCDRVNAPKTKERVHDVAKNINKDGSVSRVPDFAVVEVPTRVNATEGKDHIINDCRNRFLHLKQDNKPIEQYVPEFCKYCKYGAEYIKTEKDKCRKFIDGLNDELGPMLTAIEIDDFTFCLTEDNVDNNPISVMVVVETTTMFEIVRKMLTKHLVHLNTTQINNIKSPKQAQYVVQGRGKAGHSNAQTHQESQAPARMYHVKGREDEESPDVIAGIVELDSHPVYVLIESGSTHSFVYATTLERLSMKPEVVKTSLVVSNHIGKNLPINLICKENPITIRGIPFPIDLYILPNCEFDLILGLDWLGEHQAWIDCYNRRLYLRGLGNEFILLIDRKPTSIFAAMALQDEYEFGFPSMPVVYEFIDVFPEELPGLPPT